MNKLNFRSLHVDWAKIDWEDLALPLVLMVTGLALLGGNWLGVLSLDRIQNLWPAAVIMIGLAEWAPALTAHERQAARRQTFFDRYEKRN